MLQRNTSGYPKDFPTLDPPRRVWPGEDIDHDGPLAGFTPVDELDDEPPRETTSGNTDDTPVTSADDGEPRARQTSTSRGDKK